MNIDQHVIRLREVLPSAFGIMFLGFAISLFYQPWAWFGVLDWLAIPAGITVGCVVYYAMFMVSASPALRVDSIQSLLLMLHQLFKNLTWPQIVFVSFLAGIGEELLIRGALQSYLISITSPWTGMLVATLIFGLMHFLSKMYVLITFIIGLVFAFIFYVTDSMVLVMVAHTVYDIFAFAMIVKFPHMLGLELHNEQITIIDEADC